MGIQFENYDQLKDLLTGYANGVATIEMGQLRDVHGAGKLGSRVIQGISDELDARGIAYQTDHLPNNQWESVRLYVKDSSAGRILEAMASLGDDSDKLIRSAIDHTASQTLEKIKEIISK